MQKLKCVSISILLLSIVIISVTAQTGLYISSGSTMIIKTGTVFSVDSLSLIPSSDFTIIGPNQITRTANPYHPLDRLYIKKVFHALSTLEPFSGSISIYYSDADLNSIDESSLSLGVNEDRPNWDIYNENVIRDGANNFVTASGLVNVNLNEATLVDPNTILPLTFTLFNADCRSGIVVLTWNTAQEHGTKKFDVEKSITGNNWQVTASVNALGQQRIGNSYSINDYNSIAGNLYRIVQYDVNGRKLISSIIRASCSAAESFNIYPNPVRNAAILNIHVNEATTVMLQLTDAKGSLVKKMQKSLLPGTNQLQFDMTAIIKGYYNLTAYWSNQVKVSRVVKE